MVPVLFTVLSCEKDTNTNEVLTKNAKVSKYLDSFYHSKFQFGRSVKSKALVETTLVSKVKEIGDILITEVFVADEERARGYVLTDKNEGTFLYFIDVDRINFKLTPVKIDCNDVKNFKNIDDLQKYVSTNEFDFIKIAEDFGVLAIQNAMKDIMKAVGVCHGAISLLCLLDRC